MIFSFLACALAVPLHSTPSLAQDDAFDATVLALELYGPSGIIRAPEITVTLIAEDLARVRATDPIFNDVHVFPAWAPGSVGIKLTPDAWAEYQAGTFTGFDEILGLYPVDYTNEYALSRLIFVHFEEDLHSANLAALFQAVEGVEYAEPSYVAGDGSDITAYSVGYYLFKLGWGDCLAGCINNHYWEIVVSGSVVLTLNEYGDELPVSAETVAWGRLKSLFR